MIKVQLHNLSLAGYTLAENSTVTLNDDSEYISGCAECNEHPSGKQ